ncbi:MAG: ATP synthase F1 subunit gamma [Elusimicrobia bacterium]|nr:ATP synthase F1 subunit gamma [Elusimicrobiota bacterium]
MASLREIKRKIKSVKATRQIMYTMKMVASARIKKAQNAILSSRPFALKLEELVSELQGELRGALVQDDARLREFFSSDGKPDAALCLVLVSSDKGMCGPFNSNIIRQAVPWLRAHKGRKIYAFAVGRKARDFLRSLRGLDMVLVKDLTGIFPNAGFAHAEMLGAALLETYASKNVGGVTVIYNEFKSLLTQKPAAMELLPLIRKEARPQAGRKLRDYSFEPGKAEFLKLLVPRYIKAQLYRVLLESQAAELAARMNAMESASNNADDIISGLTLRLNRTRQSAITTELTEIVAGAEALKS